MDSSTLNVMQRVLAAYGSQRDDINDSDLDDEQPLALTVHLTLGDIRRSRMMVSMNGNYPADFPVRGVPVSPNKCATCGGRGYVVHDSEWEPYAVQCPNCASKSVSPAIRD